MNLRVDLILETEKRSGSFVTSKGALRIVTIVVPVILLIVVLSQIVTVSQLGQELKSVKLALENAQPQQERARNLIAEFQNHRDLQTELAGWNRSRLPWSRQFMGVMGVVPANIQFQELSVSQTLQLTNDAPARLFVPTLRGKAVGAEAEQSVKLLESQLMRAPTFTSQIADVSVPVYGASTEQNADRNDRVFQIVCQYAQRVFQ